MPLVLEHPTCAQLPAAARKAVCETEPASVTVAEAGDRKLVVALHVDDGRPWDGPYLETRAVWASWKPAADESAIGELLAGLGPVTGRKDAWTRLALRTELMSAGDGGRIVVPEDAVLADDAHPGAFVAKSSYVDALSCECSVTWTKSYAIEFSIAADGAITHTEKMTSCEAYPRSATKDVCGK